MDAIRADWGENLKPLVLPPDIRAMMPEETARLIETVGLPQDPQLEQGQLFLKFAAASDEVRLMEVEGKRFIVLGERWFSDKEVFSKRLPLGWVGIEVSSGEFYFLPSVRDTRAHFANSGLAQFLRCAAIWMPIEPEFRGYYLMRSGTGSDYDKEKREQGKQGILRLMSIVTEKFPLIDPVALDKNVDGVWCEFVFEMEIGAS